MASALDVIHLKGNRYCRTKQLADSSMPSAHFAFFGPKVTITVLILENERVEKFDVKILKTDLYSAIKSEDLEALILVLQ